MYSWQETENIFSLGVWQLSCLICGLQWFLSGSMWTPSKRTLTCSSNCTRQKPKHNQSWSCGGGFLEGSLLIRNWFINSVSHFTEHTHLESYYTKAEVKITLTAAESKQFFSVFLLRDLYNMHPSEQHFKEWLRLIFPWMRKSIFWIWRDIKSWLPHLVPSDTVVSFWHSLKQQLTSMSGFIKSIMLPIKHHLEKTKSSLFYDSLTFYINVWQDSKFTFQPQTAGMLYK